jgi:hypothetical protein
MQGDYSVVNWQIFWKKWLFSHSSYDAIVEGTAKQLSRNSRYLGWYLNQPSLMYMYCSEKWL